MGAQSIKNPPPASPENYAALRRRLISRGFTLRSFALKFGYSIPTVYDAAHGRRAGVLTSKIRRHLHAITAQCPETE